MSAFDLRTETPHRRAISLPFVDQEVVALLPRFDCGRQPPWHRATSRPGLRPVLRIAVLGSHPSALQRASSWAADCLLAQRYPTPIAKGRKLTLQLVSLAGQIRSTLSRSCKRASTDIEARLALTIGCSLEMEKSSYIDAKAVAQRYEQAFEILLSKHLHKSLSITGALIQ